MNKSIIKVFLSAGALFAILTGAHTADAQQRSLTADCKSSSAKQSISLEADGSINIVPCPNKTVKINGAPIGASAADTGGEYKVGGGGLSNLSAALAAAGSTTPVTVNIASNQTLSAPATIPSNVRLKFTNGARFIKSGSGKIEFEGVGLDVSAVNEMTPIFSGFSAGDVVFTGDEYPHEINVELFSSTTINSFSEKWENASLAFAGKTVTIRVSTNGNITNQIRVRENQTLAGFNCYLRDMPPTLTAAFPIVMENGSAIIGNNNESFRIYERVSTTQFDKGAGSVPRYVNYLIGATPVSIIKTVAIESGGFNRPAKNINVRNTGFYGNHNLTGYEDVGSAIALGNCRSCTVDGNRFEGVHAFHAGIGGITSPDALPNGAVNTNGVNVTIATGSTVTNFPAFLVGETIQIGGVDYTVAAVPSATTLTLDADAGTQTGAAMVTLFTAEDCKITNNISRYGVSQLYYVTTGKRFEIANNTVYDFQTPTTSQNAAIDIEPNAVGDIIENGYIHHNKIDGTNARQYWIGIIAQAGGSKNPIRFLKIENNSIIGGYLEGTTNKGMDNLTRGIVLTGAEYVDIENNLITHANLRALDIENASRVSVSNNSIIESGGNDNAVHAGAVYDSVFQDNKIQSNNLGGNQHISESEVADRSVAVSGVNVARRSGQALFFPHLVGKTVTVNGVAATVAAVQDLYNLTLSASAGTNSATTITMPPNTITYKGNTASIQLMPDSQSSVSPVERIFISSRSASGNTAGATAASPTTVFNTVQTSSYEALSRLQGRGLWYEGDEIDYKFAGSFAATASTDKRVIAQVNGANVFIDSGDLATSGDGWAIEIRGIALTPNSQKWISTFSGGGTNRRKVLYTAFANYENIPINVLAAGTLTNDVTIETKEAKSIYGISGGNDGILHNSRNNRTALEIRRK